MTATPTLRLGCVADDFTGATDVASLLARSGVPVTLRLGTPEAATPASSGIEVIALKCRNLPPRQAVDEVLAAADWLLGAGAEQLYWKYCSTFDSTAEGNIGPVAEALAERQDSRWVIYCPAFPENGRTCYFGNLFVNGQPLDESPMRDHPLTPMRDADLTRLLRPQVNGEVGLLDIETLRESGDAVSSRLDELAARNVRHVIADAIDGDDLAALGDMLGHETLLTGGSALAAELPRHLFAEGPSMGDARERIPETGSHTLLLSGSCSAMTRRQVAAYQAHGPSYRLEPMALAEGDEALDAARQWLDDHYDACPLIYASADPESVARAQAALGGERAGMLVEAALAALADHAYRRGVRRFVVAGGESSGAVAQALGVSQLRVAREIAPGVPWTFAERDGEALALTLKSGNFGDENFFAKALETLS
ncbi:3-oxo-tetronate kinase [Modicisalibacter radicis]|uniref:3-oxo-tetronate kinase n=1 Tax=Halomonas sp. EAR18 TaxID=2518972 RepID=UPI00109D5ECA|nr:3-oxo-tetronate kinase [Halomonas sp. EAR18]